MRAGAYRIAYQRTLTYERLHTHAHATTQRTHFDGMLPAGHERTQSIQPCALSEATRSRFLLIFLSPHTNYVYYVHLLGTCMTCAHTRTRAHTSASASALACPGCALLAKRRSHAGWDGRDVYRRYNDEFEAPPTAADWSELLDEMDGGGGRGARGVGKSCRTLMMTVDRIAAVACAESCIMQHCRYVRRM